ncbi:hypothetical protein YYC_04877 [Plasmodium yoelii 17X]|uniref:Plasmodium variant antigen protein Cir/Yir/Bir n=1 Tax=Plasmodium yoelii 17X TaxID=1323249 RepID=V7PDE5_PLAYE|nr:hypothetical protein YYC_04877 [Plasmodium yoelii 17X]
MSKELFSTIKRLDNCFSREVLLKEGKCCYVPYKDYCPTKQNGKKGECSTNYEKISAGFIWLLDMFKDNYGDNIFVIWISETISKTTFKRKAKKIKKKMDYNI